MRLTQENLSAILTAHEWYKTSIHQRKFKELFKIFAIDPYSRHFPTLPEMALLWHSKSKTGVQIERRFVCGVELRFY